MKRFVLVTALAVLPACTVFHPERRQLITWNWENLTNTVSVAQNVRTQLERLTCANAPQGCTSILPANAKLKTIDDQSIFIQSSLDDVRRLFALGRANRVPLTFRAAGTSLSGQAVTDGILVDLSHDWRGVEVLDGGGTVRVEVKTDDGLVGRSATGFGRLAPGD